MYFFRYKEIILKAYTEYVDYLWNEITFGYEYKPWYQNYFYGLVLISLFWMALEWIRPWREKQPRFRKDFWLDAFYMFFNFFLFSLIIFSAVSEIFVNLFNDALALVGIQNLAGKEVQSWSFWVRIPVLFIVADFLQWNVHRLLHRVPFLWEFHKVHHSIEQMGFAGHLRYHWMENVLYKSLTYIPLTMLGYGLENLFWVHIFNLFIGHFNHANFYLPLGPLRFVFNNPQMHIWHHAWEMPKSHPYGINYGLTLSVWDYIFGTAWIPESGKDIRLGFPGMRNFPKSFLGQLVYGFGRKRKEEGENRKEREGRVNH